jgi:hypothetical protein
MIFEGVDLSIWTGMVWYGKLQKSTMIWCVDQNSGYILSWGSGIFRKSFPLSTFGGCKTHATFGKFVFPPAWTLKFLSKQVRNNQYSP